MEGLDVCCWNSKPLRCLWPDQEFSAIDRSRPVVVVFCLFLQKQILAHRYIPIGYSPPVMKERARVMMLPLCPLWYHDVSFPPSVDLMLHSTPTFHLSQCPFIQMIYTDITLLPIYVNTDLARLHSMIFTSRSHCTGDRRAAWS